MSERLTSSELKVLAVLPRDECLYTRGIVEQTELNTLQARRAVKSLVRKGLAEYVRGLFDDDGMIAGSGYCCSDTGRAALQSIPQEIASD